MTRLCGVGQLMKLFYFWKWKKIFRAEKQQDFSGIKHETTASSGFPNELCLAPKIVELQTVVKENFNVTEWRHGDISDKFSALGKVDKNENLVYVCLCGIVVFYSDINFIYFENF
jgi:hypothetical protein